MGKEEMNTKDTICALATAPGGAIAVIRVSGPKAIEITNAIVIKDILKAKTATLHYTELKDHVDYALVSVFRAPHSSEPFFTISIIIYSLINAPISRIELPSA